MFHFRDHIDDRPIQQTLDDYLVDDGTGDYRKLFDVIAATNEAMNKPYQKLKKRAQGAASTDLLTVPVEPGFPWVTLVLGSGCLDERSMSDRATVSAHLSAIAACLADEPLLADGSSPAELAATFAASLLLDRLGSDDEPAQTEPDAPSAAEEVPTIDGRTARFLLLTALLTRFFHEAKALQNDALPRWGDDPAHLPAGNQLSLEVAHATLDPALRLLETLKAETRDRQAGDRPDERALAQLLEDLSVSLGRRELSVTNLRVTTECAWYVLVRDVLPYPGWSDLLLWLSLRQKPPITSSAGRPRPTYTKVSEASDPIQKRYLEATRRSWRRRLERPGDDALTFHDEAARVLRGQAALRKGNPISYALPVASAFVTTFDLELEMALLGQPDPRPFVIAMPVYLRTVSIDDDDDGPQEGVSMRWLGCLVESRTDPDGGSPAFEDLAALMQPKKWFVLSGYSGFGKWGDDYADHPVIVRLTGCPLIDLPGIDDEEFEEARGALLDRAEPGQVFEIEPALLLDEYAAMMQTAVESFLDHQDDVRLGLPRWISGVPGGENARYARFWLVTGVQMADTSIRQRLVGQLSSPALTTAPPRRPADRAGLVVNRRELDPMEAHLLGWHGFDVAKASCLALSAQLADYAGHLERLAPRPEPRPRFETARRTTVEESA